MSVFQAAGTVSCVTMQAGSRVNPKYCGTLSWSTGKSPLYPVPVKVSLAFQAPRPKGAPQSRVGLFYQSCRGSHSTKSMWLSSSPGCRDLHSGKAAWFFPFTWERGGLHPAKTTWLPLSPHLEGVLTLLKPHASQAGTLSEKQPSNPAWFAATHFSLAQNLATAI
jgi:hypothetical protein